MDNVGVEYTARAIRDCGHANEPAMGHILRLVLYCLRRLFVELDMNYKAALVTGAADRLGRAMALALAARGTKVVVHYASSEEKAQAVVKEIKDQAGEAVAIQADLLNRNEVQDLIPAANKALGPIDVLINNASIFDYDNITTADPISWDRHMASNFEAPFVLTQAFAVIALNQQGCS